jgi:hypothetical protein
MRMMRVASTSVVFAQFQITASWNTPRPSAARTVVGRRSIRPITAAARVNRSSELPPPETLVNELNPVTHTRSSTASADSTPATVQTIVDRRGTGTPIRRARSPFSAAARMAMPYGENRRKAASAATVSGTTTSVSTWAASKMTG